MFVNQVFGYFLGPLSLQNGGNGILFSVSGLAVDCTNFVVLILYNFKDDET